jgi:hypothetical protein
MSTDREVLLELVTALDRGLRREITDAAERARRHLDEVPPCDCTAEAARASRASYAAGVAHGVDARPDRRQGATVDP